MDETKYPSKIKLLGYLAILFIVVGSLLLYFEYSKSQNLIEDKFLDSRNEIASGTLAKLKAKVDSEYAYLFKDCANRAEYDILIDKDSRTMSVADLKRGLSLHSECADLFVNKSKFIVDLLRTRLDSLRFQSDLFGVGEKGKNAKVLVEYWEDIYDLERERVIIYSRLVDIQEAYWKTDLDKSLNIITSEEREAVVGALNFEANQKLDETNEVIEKAKEARRIEGLFWSEAFEKNQPSQ